MAHGAARPALHRYQKVGGPSQNTCWDGVPIRKCFPAATYTLVLPNYSFSLSLSFAWTSLLLFA